jgi:hypothetical protein
MKRKTRSPKKRQTAKTSGRRLRAGGKTGRKRQPRRRTKRDDAIETLVAASAQALGLPLDPAWRAAVKFNFQLILRHAALVDEFPLPDDAEPAPVFHA